MSAEEEKQEIIIVKRSGGGGDGHHGGAWKIAFADFMTAMMALFLVLWLVNAANEKTKKSVASYFNPVKLIDRTRSIKGLEESSSSDLPAEEDDEEDKKNDGQNRQKQEIEVSETTVREEDFFKDPFAVLDDLAKSEIEKLEVAMSVQEEFSEAVLNQEDALLDPFAEVMKSPEDEQSLAMQVANAETNHAGPGEKTSDQGTLEQRGLDSPVKLDDYVLAASLEVEQRDGATAAGQTQLAGNKDKSSKKLEKAEGETKALDAKAKAPDAKAKAADANAEAHDAAEIAEAEKMPKAAEELEAEKKMKAEEFAKAEVRKKAEEFAKAEARKKAEKVAETAEKIKSEAHDIRQQIKQRLEAKLGRSEQISESLSVKIQDDGVLISITDQFGFSMFQVGSAIPKGEVVLAMAEISTVLSSRPGKVRVYGHTDGRPYSGKDYDNWRLSTARAHAARLMLERGGLQEKRVSQVVGFSDRVLRVPGDPEAEENRRIEILLEVL